MSDSSMDPLPPAPPSEQQLTQPETETQAQTQTQTQTQIEGQTQSPTETETETHTHTETEAEAETKTEAETEADAAAQSDTQAQTQAQHAREFEVNILAANTATSFAVNAKDELVEYGDSEEALILRDAVTKFNIKPKACRDFLIAKKIIQGLPSEFAEFILHQPKISKRRIGEYIGGVETLNQLVCEHLFSLYDFGGHTLDAALRRLLQQFRLPGEAQQIDRILEKFATHYHRQNEGVFLNSDTAYVLAFSIIMLNTDLHNQAILPDKKMTLEQFIRNNRGINQGQDVGRDILERLYRDIKGDEIRMDEGDMYENEVIAFMAPTKSGIA
jgi:brefeldin A-inhibited guanine nucleotide-exchange protein